MFRKHKPDGKLIDGKMITDFHPDALRVICGYLDIPEKSKLLRTCKFFSEFIKKDSFYQQYREQFPIVAQDRLSLCCHFSLNGMLSYKNKVSDLAGTLTVTKGYGSTGYKRELYYRTLLTCQDSSLFIKAIGLYCIFALEGGTKLKKYIRNAIFSTNEINPANNNDVCFSKFLNRMIRVGFSCEENLLETIADEIYKLQQRDEIKEHILSRYGDGTGAMYRQMNDEKYLQANLNKAICDIQNKHGLMNKQPSQPSQPSQLKTP